MSPKDDQANVTPTDAGEGTSAGAGAAPAKFDAAKMKAQAQHVYEELDEKLHLQACVLCVTVLCACCFWSRFVCQ